MIDQAPRCGDCKALYDRKGERPPCETCYVEPFPRNKDAVKIFACVRFQFIMGFNGPVSLSHSAIHGAMDLYEVKERRECFERVQTLEHWWLNKVRTK